MTKKYFFFDIDGTLLSEIDHMMPDSCRETLQTLEKNGHFVAIATSRPYYLTKDTAKEMGIKNYVCDGGDGLVINEELVEILPLNKEDALSLAKECIEANLPIATSIDITNNRYSPDIRFISSYPKLKHAFDFVTQDGFDVLQSQSIHKMCIYCTKEDEQHLPSLSKVPHNRLEQQMILEEAVDKYKGIINMMKRLNASLDDVVEKAKANGRDLLFLILDGVEDPHNLGSIMRVAECAGVTGIIIPKNRSVSVNETVVRVSVGASEHVNVIKVTNINSTIEELKKKGVFVFAADMDGQEMYSVNLKGDIAIVVGSEGFGVSALTRKLCDGIISIPMFGKVNSLNASVSAGVVIYEAVRQRRK